MDSQEDQILITKLVSAGKHRDAKEWDLFFLQECCLEKNNNPLIINSIEKNDEDLFWDDLEVFISSLDKKQSSREEH